LPQGKLSLRHFRSIHHHLFQDVYRWAGRFRTVRIHKGTSTFCYPEHIPDQMKRLFGNLRDGEYFVQLSPMSLRHGLQAFLRRLTRYTRFARGMADHRMLSWACWPLALGMGWNCHG